MNGMTHCSTKTSPILLLSLALFVTTASAADSGKIFTAEDFAHDRVPHCSPQNETISLLVQISSKLPAYQFTLIPEPVAAADGTIHHVGRIEISAPGTGAILQTIEVRSNWDDSICRLFDAKDINFDGYLDISVVREGAATWSSRDYYLFDPQSRRFISNRLTRDLDELRDNGLSFDWKTHEIHAAFMFSLCGGTDVYRIENGRLIKIQEDTVSLDAEGKHCIETVRRRVNGKWKVVRASASKIPQDG